MRETTLALIVTLTSLLALPLVAIELEDGRLETEPGVEIYWRAAGDGPALIIPGDFLLGSEFESLARSHRVVLYDMRNRGRSSTITDPELLTIEGDIRDLEALRRHLDIPSFSTIGYSYLGKMVVLYALEHPERVERIVQIGPVAMRFDSAMPSTLDHTSDVVIDRDELARVRELREQGLHARDPRAYCEAEWSVTRVRLVGDPALATTLESHCELPNEWPANLAFHMQHAFPSAQRADVGPLDLFHLDQPVLTIHGTLDRNAPYGSGVEWAAMLPNARLRTVAGAAHAAWIDDPSVILDIEMFLAGEWPESVDEVEIAKEMWLSQLRGVEILRRVEEQARLDGDSDSQETLSLKTEGRLFVRSQSRSATPPWDSFPYESEVLYTGRGTSVAVDDAFHWPNFVSKHRTVYQPDREFELDLNSRRIVEPFRPPEKVRDSQLLFVPAYLVDLLLRAPGSIRLTGIDRDATPPVILVDAQLGEDRVTLRIDTTSRLRSISRLVPGQITGDGLESIDLAGEQRVGNLLLPERVHRFIDGALIAELAIAPGPLADVSRFEIPDDFTKASGERRELALEQLADHVWIVRHIGGADYNSLVVVHNDGLVLVETPQNPGAMSDVITMLQNRFPGHPLKAAVVTHHHFDHAGGVRAALVEGASMLAPRGMRELLLQIATAPRTLEDGQSAEIDRWSLRIEEVDTAVIRPNGEGPVVHLYSLETEHAEQILFAWLPAEKILFQGDLYVKYGEPEPAREQGVRFLEQIRELGLEPERIIGVHGRTATLQDLEQSVRLSEQSSN